MLSTNKTKDLNILKLVINFLSQVLTTKLNFFFGLNFQVFRKLEEKMSFKILSFFKGDYKCLLHLCYYPDFPNILYRLSGGVLYNNFKRMIWYVKTTKKIVIFFLGYLAVVVSIFLLKFRRKALTTSSEVSLNLFSKNRCCPDSDLKAAVGWNCFQIFR